MEYDAIILGDGIAGLGAAIALVRRGQKVLVIGRPDLKGASTARAAGILDPFLEMNAQSPLFQLARQAFHGYSSWLKSLGVSSAKVGYKKMGMLYLAMNSREEAELRRRLVWQKKTGIPVRWLSSSEILKKESQVNPNLRGGLFYQDLPRIQPEKLMKGLTSSAQKKGVQFLKTKFSEKLIVSKSRIEGLRIGDQIFKTNHVIQSQGAWAKLPVQPARGQILIVKKGKSKISSMLHSIDGGYIVPWDKETLLLGSTVELAGFKPVTTSEGLASIRRRIERIVPSLKGAKIVKTWAGLRPFPKDRLPIIGAASVKGLYWAAGYYRSGILIGGLAGELLAEGITTGKMPKTLKPFSVNRFDKSR